MAVVGDAISTLALKAVIHITCPAGSTLVIKKGSTIVAQPSNVSSYDYEVLGVNFGTYSIYVNGESYVTKSVNVTSPTTYNVTFTAITYDIFNAGNKNGFSFAGGGSGGVSVDSSRLKITTSGGDKWYWAWANKTLSVNAYSKLRVTTVNMPSNCKINDFGLATNQTEWKAPTYRAGTTQGTNGTFTLDIASITGSYYVKFAIGNSSHGVTVYLSRIWFTGIQ